ncbi:MAG: hypothetical protein DME59_16860 [Verrucomicrobia bacterium]|nr:MAG: hypothetical protein DME59_16860 [Verrucomicrobiota bacterium]
MLLNRRGRKIAARNVELIPGDDSRAVGEIQHCGLVRPQRFRPIAVLIDNRRHDLIAQGIQFYRRSRLGHKVICLSGPCLNEWVDCNLGIRSVVGTYTESGICRIGKIDMKEPGVHLGQGCPGNGRIDSEHHFIPPRRWRISRAMVRSNKAIRIAHASEADCKADRVRWATT